MGGVSTPVLQTQAENETYTETLPLAPIFICHPNLNAMHSNKKFLKKRNPLAQLL